MTRAEKLEGKTGHKVICDRCLKAKEFNNKWRETADKEIVCPECARELSGKVLVSV
uniref:Uncharacterized protein n=1 Tax=viral metagenome TaxID=1070528 RepID=A0A6M3KX76_9ZZZZ